MKRANVIRGRIEEHGAGLGTADESLVRQRAGEIAVTNGRLPGEANKADMEQARAELEAAQNAPADSEQEDAFIVRDGPPASQGQSVPTRLPTDEETLPEDLVAEGVNEADHEQMLAGNDESRRRDLDYEDQLPGTD